MGRGVRWGGRWWSVWGGRLGSGICRVGFAHRFGESRWIARGGGRSPPYESQSGVEELADFGGDVGAAHEAFADQYRADAGLGELFDVGVGVDAAFADQD